ncbi:helix-turn-helix domain-containing protein [Chitinophaga solisilvae]|uniref:helix-turn-helix domain-containing protein n=1 Tax=Chitinophaga solisilvae TaxID=1233460 RepID=UPI00136CE555|nr:helix-turn-helix transcriptional regulator [Chitinophaga solisilvae]
MNWGKAIVDIRKKRQLTQSQLAQKAGLSDAALSAIETEKSRPSEENLKKIAASLDTDPGVITLLAVNPETDMNEEARAKFHELFPDFHKLIFSTIR